jgi:hypothetical protein
MFTIAVNRYKESFDIDVGRGSRWGNPYSHEAKSRAQYIVSSREEAIELYSFWILGQPELIGDLDKLKGKRLGCFCLPKSCHATVLADLADKFDTNSEFSDYSAFW